MMFPRFNLRYGKSSIKIRMYKSATQRKLNFSNADGYIKKL